MIDPGGDILDPGAAERIADSVVERRYLFKPKDEEAPPDGGNWFEHNYKPRPAAMSIRVQIQVKPLAEKIDPFIQVSDMASVINLCSKAKIKVVSNPGNPIITLEIVPGDT
jgi:hypothetical protein